MSVVLTNNGQIFRPFAYEKEADFEADVVRLADQLFGSGSIYVDVKKRIGSDIVTIPDGYLIDTAEPNAPELFVIENEIVSHDPFKHIGIQMLKFVTSFEEAQRTLRTFLMREIRADRKMLERLESACKQSNSANVDEYLDKAVYKPFSGLVVIDEARPELHRVLEKINANISVLVLKTFVSDSGEKLHEFDTLYDEFEDEEVVEESRAPSRTPEARTVRRDRRAMSDTIIVPAREEGFQNVFMGENQWYAIRIGAGMKDRLKYIAAYRVTPISAVTHVAEIQEIKPYRDTGKYLVVFKGPAREIGPIPAGAMRGMQSPIYVQSERLNNCGTLAEVVSSGEAA